jgi:hypothetical protein
MNKLGKKVETFRAKEQKKINQNILIVYFEQLSIKKVFENANSHGNA